MEIRTAKDARREARQAGLDWADVQYAFEFLNVQEREKREIPNAIRQRAWEFATSEGCHPFWRHGFESRWGKKVAEQDHTVIPGYDDIAREVAFHFPQFDHANGTEELFDFLFSKYDRLPTAGELYAQAIDYVLNRQLEPVGCPDDYPEF